MMSNVVPFRAVKLEQIAGTVARLIDAETDERLKRRNDSIIARLRGVPGLPGTAETDADPQNPNVDPATEA